MILSWGWDQRNTSHATSVGQTEPGVTYSGVQVEWIPSFGIYHQRHPAGMEFSTNMRCNFENSAV